MEEVGTTKPTKQERVQAIIDRLVLHESQPVTKGELVNACDNLGKIIRESEEERLSQDLRRLEEKAKSLAQLEGENSPVVKSIVDVIDSIKRLQKQCSMYD